MNREKNRTFCVFIVLFVVLTSCTGCIETFVGTTATVHFSDGTEKQYKGVDSVSSYSENRDCIPNVAILGIVGSRDGVFLKYVDYIEFDGRTIEFNCGSVKPSMR